MKKLFLTSGLILCMACPAFAVQNGVIEGEVANPNADECVQSVLGTDVGPATLEAIWDANSYNVIYAPGAHGTGGDTFTNDATYDASYTLRGLGTGTGASTVTADTGYSFTGWLGSSTAAGYTPATYTETQTINPYQIAGPLTLTAQWQANTHNISYATGTAGARTTGFSGSMANTSATYDASVTLRTNAFTIPGYGFAGWSSTVNLASGATAASSYTDGQTINPYKVDDDVTLTATWTPLSYTISYGSGAHGSVPNNGTDPVAYANGLTYDATWTTKTFAETGIAADTGYTFSGWNTAADGTGTPYAAGTSQSAWTTDAGLTLYAIYTANTHSITYTCGSVPSGSQSSLTDTPPAAVSSIAYNSPYTLATTEGGCELPGYHFGGWHCSHNLATGSTNNDAGQDYASTATTVNDVTTYSVTASGTFLTDANVTCSVIWTPNEIGLTWVAGNGATFTAPENDSCTYDEGITLPATDPTKTGYTFGGWEVQTQSQNP